MDIRHLQGVLPMRKIFQNKKFLILLIGSFIGVIIVFILIHIFSNATGKLIIKDNTLLGFRYGYIDRIGDNKVLRIPEGITEIKPKALEGCDFIDELIIPDTVIEIGESAFANCTGIKKVKMPQKISII